MRALARAQLVAVLALVLTAVAAPAVQAAPTPTPSPTETGGRFADPLHYVVGPDSTETVFELAQRFYPSNPREAALHIIRLNTHVLQRDGSAITELSHVPRMGSTIFLPRVLETARSEPQDPSRNFVPTGRPTTSPSVGTKATSTNTTRSAPGPGILGMAVLLLAGGTLYRLKTRRHGPSVADLVPQRRSGRHRQPSGPVQTGGAAVGRRAARRRRGRLGASAPSTDTWRPDSPLGGEAVTAAVQAPPSP